jgi:hypothetical protein
VPSRRPQSRGDRWVGWRRRARVYVSAPARAVRWEWLNEALTPAGPRAVLSECRGRPSIGQRGWGSSSGSAYTTAATQIRASGSARNGSRFTGTASASSAAWATGTEPPCRPRPKGEPAKRRCVVAHTPYSRRSLIQQASEKGHCTAPLRNARSGNVKRRSWFQARLRDR